MNEHSFSHIECFHNTVITMFLNVLLATIIENYFQNSRCMFICSENLNELAYKGSTPIVNINILNKTIHESIVFQSYGCQEIIIQYQNPAPVLSEIEAKIKLHRDRFNFRKYLIIPTLQSTEDATHLFDLPELEYIVDILVIIPIKTKFTAECESKFKILCKQQEVYKLITHKYVGVKDYKKPEVLDYWFSKNQSFLYGNDLYPDKISNQQGRVLKCATFNYNPYSIMAKSLTAAAGSENSIAREYAIRLNMTLQYITDDNEWGIIYENWTGNGILGNLASGEADIGYGALYSWEHEFSFLDFSKPTVRTGITCLVPAPRLATGWLTPLFPFSTAMWIGTGVSFVAIYLTNLMFTLIISKQHLQRKRTNYQATPINYQNILKDSLSSVVRIFLAQSVLFKNNAMGEALRYMFLIFLFSLLLTSIYSSGLASIMTIPRYAGTIETVSDLANSDIRWGGTQDAWTFSLLAEERPQYITIIEKFIAAPQEDLIEFAKTNRFAFGIERLPSGQYAIGSYINQDAVRALRLMHEDLYWEYCIIMLRKSSPLLNSLDKFLLLVTEAGLIYFWEMQAAQTHMDLRVQNIVKYYATVGEEKQESVVKLKFVHVEGAFGILVIGCVTATLSFLIELLHYNCKNRKRTVTG